MANANDRCQPLRQAVETTRNEIGVIETDLSDSDIPADLRQRLEALRRRLQLQLRRLEIELEECEELPEKPTR
jgi:hypothetical protein